MDSVQDEPAAFYDIDVEVDDINLITQLHNSFSAIHPEIQVIFYQVYIALYLIFFNNKLLLGFFHLNKIYTC